MVSVHLVFGPLGAGKPPLAGQACSYWSSHYLDAGRCLRREQVLNRNLEKGETFAFEVSSPMFDVMNARFEQPGPLKLKECVHV